MAEEPATEQGQKRNKRRGKKVSNQTDNRIAVDFEVWGDDNQLDMFIETLFQLLNHDEAYLEAFERLRRKGFSKIHKESSFMHRFIKPEYPQFQLPCSYCYLVNEKPGNC